MSSGVFLSYSRADRELAERVVGALRAIGVDVWWDQDMPGVDWQQELERQITELTALIVLWSPASKNSEYVRDEARLALSSHKLVNALCGDVSSPPFPFDRINGLPLGGWTGLGGDPGWTRLVATLEEHMVRAGVARPRQLTDAQASRDAATGAAQRAAIEAEQAYQDAKLREAEAKEAAAAARPTLDAADAQLQRVAEMHVSPAILRAAQTEFDAARAAAEAAEAERKAAAAALSSASRALTRAKAELERMTQGAVAVAHAPDGSASRSAETAAPPKDVLAAEDAPTSEEPDARSDGGQAATDDAGAIAAKAARLPIVSPPPPPPPPRPPRGVVIGGAIAAGAVSLFLVVALIGHGQGPDPNLPANTVAEATNNAETAEARDDAATAVYWWRIAASAGDPDAQFKMGHAYEAGQGVSTDAGMARVWYQKAAAGGNAQAQAWLVSNPPPPPSNTTPFDSSSTDQSNAAPSTESSSSSPSSSDSSSSASPSDSSSSTTP